MRKFRTYNQVDHDTGSELLEQVLDQRARLSQRLSSVGTIVAIASGKGGVGKSAVTANLAVTLASRGHAVGVVDADLNGPSLARMLGVTGQSLEDGEDGVVPAAGAAGVSVISMELFQEGADAPLRWKEPSSDTFLWQSSMETTALREFLGDVAWGVLDFLLVDVPPGTDKIRRLLELVPNLPVALMVATPSEMSRAVVARSLRMVREAEVPEVGIVANMTEYVCPACGHEEPIFTGNGVERLSSESGVSIWGRIPFDPHLAVSTDRGAPWVLEDPNGPAAQAFDALAERVEGARNPRAERVP
ncbi:MAG: ATP-binding protein [Gemmatimonadetes bacterium]|nr:ATP-binding protein [Gemmatimonadota bacterium]